MIKKVSRKISKNKFRHVLHELINVDLLLKLLILHFLDICQLVWHIPETKLNRARDILHSVSGSEIHEMIQNKSIT